MQDCQYVLSHLLPASVYFVSSSAYKMKFWPPFLFQKIEVYVALIHNFRVWASDQRARIFSRASKLANSCQNVRHSAKMQIGTVDVIRCVKPSSHHSI